MTDSATARAWISPGSVPGRIYNAYAEEIGHEAAAAIASKSVFKLEM